jgi:hypothetical protein
MTNDQKRINKKSNDRKPFTNCPYRIVKRKIYDLGIAGRIPF